MVQSGFSRENGKWACQIRRPFSEEELPRRPSCVSEKCLDINKTKYKYSLHFFVIDSFLNYFLH